MFDLKHHMGLFENFHKITFRNETKPFPCRAPREMKLYLNLGTWQTPWRVVMHPSWDWNWIVPSPITLLVAEFPMKTSSPWIKVYEEKSLKLICCEHPKSMTHLSLLPTDLSVTDRMSHGSSSPSTSSVTLTSGCFFFQSQHSDLMCPFLWQ